MTTTGVTMKGTLSERLAQVREQQAYRARVAAFGLPALLAPYGVKRRWLVNLPEQRQGQ